MSETPLTQTVTLTRTEAEPESLELLVATIRRVADGFDRAMKAGATEDLIILLLHDRTRVSKTDIRAVLRAAPRLAASFLTAEVRKETR